MTGPWLPEAAHQRARGFLEPQCDVAGCAENAGLLEMVPSIPSQKADWALEILCEYGNDPPPTQPKQLITAQTQSKNQEASLMEHYQQLSAEELKAQLEQIEAQKAALADALRARAEDEKRALAEEIRRLIQERGFDLEDISDRVLSGLKRRRAGSSSDVNAGYTRYADPDDPQNVYVRGRMPSWMVEKMSAHGYDPSSAEHRAEFKEKHLIRVSG